MFKRLVEPESVRRYRHYRAAALALNSKIMEAKLPQAVFDWAVRG